MEQMIMLMVTGLLGGILGAVLGIGGGGSFSTTFAEKSAVG